MRFTKTRKKTGWTNSRILYALSAVALEPPTFVSAETSADGSTVILTFSKEMADPAGKHAAFTVTVAGSGRTVTAAALNADTTKIDLTLDSAATNGQTITVAYSAGTVTSEDGGILESFAAQMVTNNVPSPYQQWTGQPQSPVTTADYPYQYCAHSGGAQVDLFVCKSKLYVSGSTLFAVNNAFGIKSYYRTTGGWEYAGDYGAGNGISLNPYTDKQCNYDIYTNSSMSSVYLAKTTP